MLRRSRSKRTAISRLKEKIKYSLRRSKESFTDRAPTKSKIVKRNLIRRLKFSMSLVIWALSNPHIFRDHRLIWPESRGSKETLPVVNFKTRTRKSSIESCQANRVLNWRNSLNMSANTKSWRSSIIMSLRQPSMVILLEAPNGSSSPVVKNSSNLKWVLLETIPSA